MFPSKNPLLCILYVLLFSAAVIISIVITGSAMPLLAFNLMQLPSLVLNQAPEPEPEDEPGNGMGFNADVEAGK